MFGPMNFGVPEEEARRRAHELIELLGLPPEVARSRLSIYLEGRCDGLRLQASLRLNRPSSFWTSRLRDSIRGDEKKSWSFSIDLHVEEKLTTILVTHSMEDAARYADQIIVMHDGRSVMAGTPQEVFGDDEKLKSFRLGLPRSVTFQRDVEKLIGRPVQEACIDGRAACEDNRTSR